MAKASTPKKTPAEKQADLLKLMGGTNVATLTELTQQNEASTTGLSSADEVEQEGEKAPAGLPTPASAALPDAPTAPADAPPAAAPAAAPVVDEALLILPEPTPTVAEPGPAQAPLPESPALAPEPASVPTAAEAQESPVGTEQPNAPVAAPPAAPVPVAEAAPTNDEPATDEPATDERAAGPATEAFDLASLFAANPPGRKGVTSRLSPAHHQYFQLIGTVLGNGTSVPEIVHNILQQFIAQNDAEIQKALTKALRAARTLPKKS